MADEEEQVTQDIGGVQGADGSETDSAESAPKLGGTLDRPAPDAGEIEWSGGLIKKPPTPGA